MKYDGRFFIAEKEIALDTPTYFIADIASNHDGDLSRAKDLIWLAKESGLDAVKFQHFKANRIVSDFGFRNLGSQMSHQSSWKKSVFEVYQQYECNRDWNGELVETARKAGIHFMTTPYDVEAVEMLEQNVPAFKIGSGDITWTEFISFIAQRNKPVLLATGASCMDDVERAVEAILTYNRSIVLMQCNTNYTGSLVNFRYINLNVLKSYAVRYPGMVLGLSDHTPGHATVLGAITLGARVIEKHFTDDNSRIGPDHPFSLAPAAWAELIERSRELESSLGYGIKRVEDNECDTVIVQRRCLRLTGAMKAGQTLSRDDLEALRPAPVRAFPPHALEDVVGKTLVCDKEAGDALYEHEVRNTVC